MIKSSLKLTLCWHVYQNPMNRKLINPTLGQCSEYLQTGYQIVKKQKMLFLSLIFGLFYLIVLAEGYYDSKLPNLIEYIDITNCKSGKQVLDIVPGASLTFYYRLLIFKKSSLFTIFVFGISSDDLVNATVWSLNIEYYVISIFKPLLLVRSLFFLRFLQL